MKLEDRPIGIAGKALIETFDATSGQLVEQIEAENLVVDSGLDSVRDLLGFGGVGDDRSTPNRPSHIVLGTGSTAVTAADTSLQIERFRGQITRRLQGTTGVLNLILFMGQEEGNGFAFTETGIVLAGELDSPVGSKSLLFSRLVHPAVTKTDAVVLTVTYPITLKANP